MSDALTLNAQTLGLPVTSAEHLNERYQSLVEALTTENAPAMCDAAKTLLETVFRTVIVNRNGAVVESPDSRASFVELYRQALESLTTHDSDEIFMPVIKRSVTVIASMRDNYGDSSHGQDGYHERKLDLAEAVLLARLALTISGYMYSRHVHTSTDHGNSRSHYADNPEFNKYLDSEGDIEVAGIFVAPSRILFDNDFTAYRDQLLEHSNDMYISEMEAAGDLWMEMQNDIARGK